LHSPSSLELGLLHPAGTVDIKNIVGQLQQSIALPMISSPAVLTRGLLDACANREIDFQLLGHRPARPLDCATAEAALRDPSSQLGVRPRRSGSGTPRHRNTKRGSGSQPATEESRIPRTIVRFPSERRAHDRDENDHENSSAASLVVERLWVSGTIDASKYGDLFRTIVAPLQRIDSAENHRSS
jgi:hypothetical protein